jgi:hypothetical protein
VQDPLEKLVPGFGLNRDPERVPMRWDSTSKGGFTTGSPWLPMVGQRQRNVADLQNDDRSILHLYRQLIRLRRKSPALRSGDYAPLRSRDGIFMYERTGGHEKFRIALNLTHEGRRLEIPVSQLLSCRPISTKRIYGSPDRSCCDLTKVLSFEFRLDGIARAGMTPSRADPRPYTDPKLKTLR